MSAAGVRRRGQQTRVLCTNLIDRCVWPLAPLEKSRKSFSHLIFSPSCSFMHTHTFRQTLDGNLILFFLFLLFKKPPNYSHSIFHLALLLSLSSRSPHVSLFLTSNLVNVRAPLSLARPSSHSDSWPIEKGQRYEEEKIKKSELSQKGGLCAREVEGGERQKKSPISVQDYRSGFRGDVITCCTACQEEWDEGTVFSDAPVRGWRGQWQNLHPDQLQTCLCVCVCVQDE